MEIFECLQFLLIILYLLFELLGYFSWTDLIFYELIILESLKITKVSTLRIICSITSKYAYNIRVLEDSSPSL